MVEVFKTNVYSPSSAGEIVNNLTERFPEYRINFDLADCDKVLRIAGEAVDVKEVFRIVTGHGFFIDELTD